jgi:hypothetical protein
MYEKEQHPYRKMGKVYKEIIHKENTNGSYVHEKIMNLSCNKKNEY